MLSFCGVDVSKERLDVMMLPEQQSFSVRNDAAGWAELIARLRGFAIAAISGGFVRRACGRSDEGIDWCSFMSAVVVRFLEATVHPIRDRGRGAASRIDST